MGSVQSPGGWPGPRGLAVDRISTGLNPMFLPFTRTGCWFFPSDWRGQCKSALTPMPVMIEGILAQGQKDVVGIHKWPDGLWRWLWKD